MRTNIFVIIGVIIGVGVLIIVGLSGWGSDSVQTPSVTTSASTATFAFVAPISDARARITKKPFGIYVTPTDSPVSPERFTGYHTGTDFETFASEQDSDVPIYAVCDGPLREKTTATGYGGVVVQQCSIGGAPVTVIYGHMKLASIGAVVSQRLGKGQELGVLGKAYSTETGGERKHLHLGIHRGTAINIRGYVQSSSELSAWIDAAQLLP